MADVNEVKIFKDGAMTTPVVLADSIYNSDGTKFKDNFYTKAQIDARRLKTYTLPSEINGVYKLTLDALALGDMAYIKGNFTMNANSSISIWDGGSSEGKEYLLYISDANFPDSRIIEWRVKDGFVYNMELYGVSKGLDYLYKSNLKLFIIRVA